MTDDKFGPRSNCIQQECHDCRRYTPIDKLRQVTKYRHGSPYISNVCGFCYQVAHKKEPCR